MQKRRILVVEDQKLNRAVLKEILENDYELVYAENGRIALDIMEREKNDLSLVLLDIVMPVMDGYEVLRIMRKKGLLDDLPVLVASQRFGDDSELQALSLGSWDYVPKPYNPQVLKRRIENLIQMNESMKKVDYLEKDAITGLYNKIAFCNRAKDILEKYPEKKFEIIAIDIEHFRLFNSSYGYQKGDDILKYIGDKMIDLFFDKIFLSAREYADRFFVFCESEEDCPQNICDCLAEDLEHYPLDLRVHLGFGIYQIEDVNEDVSAMCDKAVCALKWGKDQYGKNVFYYDHAIAEELLFERQIMDNMGAALKNHEFQVYLQPKYDLFNEKMAGAEALVRWVHPERGIIPPNKFIPIFEKTGFITELDMFVWEKTCEIISNWIKYENKYVPVSVNVSRKDIYKENLPKYFLDLLKKYGLKQKYLHLEITESAYTEDPDQLVKVVNELKDAGFTIEMDDFGSGYSSLNMLAKLPIDVLKLDMKIIQNYGQKNSSRSIINFIMGLAKWMNLYVIAEGVETREQMELLKSMDCNYAQGYFFAKPMPNEDFENRIQTLEVLHMPSAGDDGDCDQILVREYDKEQLMLVIDDQPMNRAIITDYFRDTFSIIEATNGLVALQYLEKGGKADIIILDIYMPEMDGFQVLKKLKENPDTKDIPVIVSSQADDATIIQAIKEGAADFMTKPFAKEDALRCVDHVLSDMCNKIKKEKQELQDQMSAMEKLSMTDFLTGLWNRSHFEKVVREYLRDYPMEQCYYILMDVDNFKTINDREGHLAGDQLIQTVAERIVSCFRENDIICRMGGDEFAILMRAEMNREGLTERMELLHRSMDFVVKGVHITCSSGVSCCPKDGTDYLSLHKKADAALYLAKKDGKNRNMIYGDE